MAATLAPAKARLLSGGTVVPAHPLALDQGGRLSPRHQRAVTRYYLDAGVGGVAVGVHTTQFSIREAGLLRPVLELAAEEVHTHTERWDRPVLLIAGACGPAGQAVTEARMARELGYDAVLLSPSGLADHTPADLIRRAAAVAEVLPVVGFYLQLAVGGRPLDHVFWRDFADVPGVVAVKAAPFDRYRTWDVVRGVVASARGDEVALYTGNDDSILVDLLTPFLVRTPDGRIVGRRFVGGLLGHWAVWTRGAVELFERVRAAIDSGAVPLELLTAAAEVTDANGAFFDVAGDFRGCIAGINEVLRRQGLFPSRRCLDPEEELSPGQAEEIDRVARSYPHLADDAFVAEHLGCWLE